VGRVGRNRRDVAQRLHETLAGTGAPLMGVIANGFKSRSTGSYDYSPDRRPTTSPGDGSPNGIASSSSSDPVSTVKG
jgi:Mrp family chromosome partitioning ATPase